VVIFLVFQEGFSVLLQMDAIVHFAIIDNCSTVIVSDEELCKTLHLQVKQKMYDKSFVFDVPEFQKVHAGLVVELISLLKTQKYGFMEVGDFVKMAKLSGLEVRFY